MKTIPSEDIERTLEKLGRFNEDEISQFMERLSQHQPALVAFLLTLEPNMDLDAEQPPGENSGRYFFAGLTVLASLLEHSPNHPMVTPEQIEAAEDTNSAMLSRLDEGAEMHFQSTVLGMLESYHQAPLFIAAMHILTEEVTHEDEIDDDIAIAMLKIKAMIDCFDGQEAAPNE